MVTGMMELPRETLDWFEGDELRARVFFEKYALQDIDGTPLELTPEEMWERIAKVLSELEETEEKRQEWYEKFRWLLSNFRFIPGGRIMHAVGNPRKVTPFNCFVLPIKDDSLEAIFECAKEMARTYSQGGGVGIDISVLRPAGSPVRNAARTSTGAVSFMELYSMVTGTIGQHGRRGALMITIADNHPDVLAFIDIKNDPERRRVRYANISVRVSDELMEAVQRNGKFELRFDGEYFSIRRTVDAREIWDKLIQNAWAAAEPGTLFWSTIKRYSTSEYNGMEVISTNPCVTGDTLVSTDEGLIPIAELAKRNRLPHAILDSRVSPHFYTGAIIKAWWSGRKPVYRVVTRAGYELRATADHKILTANRGWVQVKDLQPGDLLLIQNRKGGFGRYGDEHLGRILGWLVADGHVNHHDNRAVLDFYAQDRELAPVFAQSVAAVIPTSQRYPAPSAVAVLGQERVQIRSHRLLEKSVELGFDPAEKHKIPTVVWQGSEAMVKGFLQALFTADGTVQSSLGSRFSVHLTSTNLRFLKDVQILLAHFGIASRIYENRRPEGAKLMPDGRGGVELYGTQPVHELVIGKENIVRFYREIGFLPDSSKQKKLEQIVATYARSPYRETFTTPVVDVVPEGIEDVYDLTEAVSHTFIANGLTVANCGEEPLPAYGNCNLGNINLSAFVLDEFTDAARVDWESLEKAVRYAVRFLDNVITYAVKEDRLPLPQQKERCAAERRIGVGFTGLGDMLAQLRLKYDTDDALEFVDELFHKIKCWAYDESVNLAIERGPFPLFDPEKHLQMGFIRERLPRELQEKIRRHGIRNVCVLTVPPVGSGAAMAGVTSGIEPIFALSYIRRSESLSKGEFKVFHPSVRRYMQKFGIDDERELPEFFVTAHQIAPEMRVRMQAIIQSHIDQSISSCLTRNNLILTDKGLRYIDTICPERREGEFVPLRGWKVANENGLVTASDFYFNGIRPIYRVILEGGYTLEGTGNHRVLTVTSDHELVWRRLDELQEGEFVVLRKGLEVWGNLRQLSEIYGRPFVADRQTNAHPIRIPHRVTKLLARFLGYLLSDGGVLSNGNTVAFTQQKGEVLEHFCHLAEQLFGIKPKLHRDLRGHNLYNAKIHSRTLVRFLEYLGAAHQGAEKRTPLCILSAGREIVKEFIRGLTLDGYVSRFADGNPRITVLCNLSERLVREVQQLLLNFGIESNIIAKPYEISDFRHLHGRIYRHERRVLYDLYVTAENAHRFMELIGFAEQRKNEEAWQLLRKTRLMRAPLGGVVPVNGQVVGTLREAMKRVRSFRLYEQIHSLTQHMRTRKVVERDNLLYALEATQTVATVPPFILDPTYTFKRVKLVVQLPEPQETFDLSVPDGHHYIANGIVSHNTVNLPHDITTQEVERIYFLAWKLGCKGITVYREGSREGVLITEEFAQQKRGRLMPKPRPMVMVGKTYKLRTEMGNVYVTVNADEEGPQEVFVRLGKSGSSAMAFTEAIGRLISLALRAGVSPEAIIDQLSGIKSSSATRQENGTIIFSVPDAVAKALEMFLKGENPPKSSALTEVLLQALSESNETELAVPPIPSIREELPQILQANGARYSGDLCPNCGEPLIHSGGCELCLFCGYSRCQ